MYGLYSSVPSSAHSSFHQERRSFQPKLDLHSHLLQRKLSKLKKLRDARDGFIVLPIDQTKNYILKLTESLRYKEVDKTLVSPLPAFKSASINCIYLSLLKGASTSRANKTCKNSSSTSYIGDSRDRTESRNIKNSLFNALSLSRIASARRDEVCSTARGPHERLGSKTVEQLHKDLESRFLNFNKNMSLDQIKENLSFESVEHDIFNPVYSSDQEESQKKGQLVMSDYEQPTPTISGAIWINKPRELQKHPASQIIQVAQNERTFGAQNNSVGNILEIMTPEEERPLSRNAKPAPYINTQQYSNYSETGSVILKMSEQQLILDSLSRAEDNSYNASNSTFPTMNPKLIITRDPSEKELAFSPAQIITRSATVASGLKVPECPVGSEVQSTGAAAHSILALEQFKYLSSINAASEHRTLGHETSQHTSASSPSHKMKLNKKGNMKGKKGGYHGYLKHGESSSTLHSRSNSAQHKLFKMTESRGNVQTATATKVSLRDRVGERKGYDQDQVMRMFSSQTDHNSSKRGGGDSSTIPFYEVCNTIEDRPLRNESRSSSTNSPRRQSQRKSSRLLVSASTATSLSSKQTFKTIQVKRSSSKVKLVPSLSQAQLQNLGKMSEQMPSKRTIDSQVPTSANHLILNERVKDKNRKKFIEMKQNELDTLQRMMRPSTSQAVKAFHEDASTTPNASQIDSEASSVKKKLKQSLWMDRKITGGKIQKTTKQRMLQPAWIEEEPLVKSPQKMKKSPIFDYKIEKEEEERYSGLVRAHLAKHRAKKEERIAKWNKY